MRGRLIEQDGMRLVAVQRHAKGHTLPPHAVPYVAIARGLVSLGIKGCLASAAVGSLHENWPVGTLAVCTDLIDVSGRNVTAFESRVAHTDVSTAFPLAEVLVECANETARPTSTYINVNGPRYESPAEIRAYAKMGGDVVGMTSGTEAVVMRELGVPYGCLAIVTNLACGIGAEEPDHNAVSTAVDSVADEVVETLLKAARHIATHK